MSCGTPLTDATVPTGMNTGVSITACGVGNRPAGALPQTWFIWKSMDIRIGIVATTTCGGRLRRQRSDAEVWAHAEA